MLVGYTVPVGVIEGKYDGLDDRVGKMLGLNDTFRVGCFDGRNVADGETLGCHVGKELIEGDRDSSLDGLADFVGYILGLILGTKLKDGCIDA